ncbi:Cbb3-type cytochrome coxidase subunit I [Haloferula helveola]|uniref:Cbb3-type cytochrome coxidase subunit I n=1 Tax=Haloferula helveola TaxID=490095 RepID=A0ABM7RBN8_9BACT|nr:Cbb3-type cytochrome coxidase subunit I [Haloferula helveola]
MNHAVRLAGLHAFGWLVVANAAGLWLSLLLLFPEVQGGELTYGRWIPVHLNGQLYGWTALPLVAWLFRIYGVGRRSAEFALWAWTAALAVGCVAWLNGGSSGKVFLDWSGGALAGLVLAMVMLWLVLALAWSRVRGVWRLIGLIALAPVPAMMAFAASPSVYPPVDVSTGGPTGSSLLGSTLFVVGLLLLLPVSLGRKVRLTGSRFPVLGFFGLSWAVFAATEAIGGTHRDWWQILAIVMLLPWAVLLPRWWRRYEWPARTVAWRISMFGWWGLLVVSGVTAYFPEVLDRLKFTQSLVAHSHLAMAGFTTSFCALLLGLLGVPVGGRMSVVIWNLAALGMVAVLAIMGWLESGGYGWMNETPAWRHIGLGLRSLCGLVMLGVSAGWFLGAARVSEETDASHSIGVPERKAEA